MHLNAWRAWVMGLIVACGPGVMAIGAERAVVGAGAGVFFEDSLRPFMSQNCFACHGAVKQSADLNLESLVANPKVEGNRPQWELVLKRLQKGEMPPAKQPRPDAAQLKIVTDWFSGEFDRLDKLDKSATGQAGEHNFRRLNRSEYNNTVRDLLGVDIRPADEFPPDDSGYGFDNMGDVLSMSPVLMERYLKAAEKVARTAVFGVEKLKPIAVTYQPWYIDFDTKKTVKTDYDETGISMPYSSHAYHRAPVDGEYEFTGWVRGFRPGGSDPLRIGFWIDGKMVHEGKVVVPPDGELNGLSDSFKTQLTAGDHWLAVSILKIYEGLPPGYKGPNPSQINARVSKSPTEFFAQNIRIVGPLSQVMGPTQQSLRSIYTCGHLDGKHDADCARKIVTDLATRAFRRPVTEGEVRQLLGLIDMVQRQGDSFEEGLCLAIQKVLISPHFIFRVENDPNRLSAYELATRLSYFLWSTMPDEELFARAADGTLSKPEVLEAQVKRMLKDPKSFALVENFGGQWLQFRALESHSLERKKFQQYTDYTRMSMQKETELFFDNIIREDRSVLEFISADYTFLNQRLAEFYGIPGVKGLEFRKVQLPADSHRGGVITQASVLTVSSYANRTSPVIRGKWVLENILNAPPPAPPPNVPSLKDDGLGSTLTVRQQLEKHRENPTCASCHSKMDPLGFGLEKFDAIGAWRTQEGNLEIDTSGVLPDGRNFSGVDDLKAILLADKDKFASCIADKMLTYALGRGLARSDEPAVQAITQQMSSDGYRFSSAVLGVVNSPQFQMRGGN